MNDGHTAGGHFAEKSERFIGHIIAMVLGFVMMVVGLSLGVTIVALPIGLAIGIAGLLLLLWGVYFGGSGKKTG